jgi:hypothetical protein
LYEIEKDIKEGKFQIFGSEELFFESIDAILVRAVVNEASKPV